VGLFAPLVGCSAGAGPEAQVGEIANTGSAASISTPVKGANAWTSRASAARPASVPAEFVATPFGWSHPSCVVTVASNELVRRTGHIERSTDSATREIPACAYPRYDRLGRTVPTLGRRSESLATGGKQHEKSRAPEVDGWAENANATSNPVEFLEAIWNVPSNPSIDDGQTDFFFPGLEPLAGDPLFIMQPVLAYNSGAWTAASWNCCVDGTQVKSDDISVRAGDSLLGQISGTGCSVVTGVCDTWSIYTRDQTTGYGTMLWTTAQDEVMNWAFAGAVEVYGVNRCADLPSNGNIDFTYVQLQVLSGARPAVWTPFTAATTPDCNWGVTSSEFDAKFTWASND
jgi:hypothetical protein